jgi:hypothetical protein
MLDGELTETEAQKIRLIILAKLKHRFAVEFGGFDNEFLEPIAQESGQYAGHVQQEASASEITLSPP